MKIFPSSWFRAIKSSSLQHKALLSSLAPAMSFWVVKAHSPFPELALARGLSLDSTKVPLPLQRQGVFALIVWDLEEGRFQGKMLFGWYRFMPKITFHCLNGAISGLWSLTLSITVEWKPETCGYHLISFQLSHVSPRKGPLVLFNTTTHGCSRLKSQCPLSGKKQFQALQNESKTTPTLGKGISYRANSLAQRSFTFFTGDKTILFIN